MTWWVDVDGGLGPDVVEDRIERHRAIVVPTALGDDVVDTHIAPIVPTEYGVRVYDESVEAWTLYPWSRVLAVGKDAEAG